MFTMLLYFLRDLQTYVHYYVFRIKIKSFHDKKHQRKVIMGRKECLSVCLSVSTHTTPIISSNDARNLAEALLYVYAGYEGCNSSVSITRWAWPYFGELKGYQTFLCGITWSILRQKGQSPPLLWVLQR